MNKTSEDTEQAFIEGFNALEGDARKAVCMVGRLLLDCVGESPQRSAMLIFGSGVTVSILSLNAEEQQQVDLMEAAHSVYDKQVIGERPEKGMLN